MQFQRVSRDSMDYWVERRIKEAYLKEKIRYLTKESVHPMMSSSIASSMWTVFKSGIKTV